MKKRTISFISILLLLLLVGILLAACVSSSSAPASSGGTAGDGQALLQQRCTACHSANRVTSAHHTAADWKTTVDRMVNKGAQLSPAEEQTLVDYLAQNYK